jgi:imidazolonepropionase-like amidohydrolase
LKRRLASGEILGPRFLANGGVVDGKPAVWPGSAVVETEAEARATVDSLTDGGADFIKTYDRLSPEAFFAIMDRARLRGIPVDGHVPLSVAATDAAAASMRTIEHGTGMLLGCSAEADSLRAIHAQHMRRPDMEDRGVATARLLVAARDSRDERLCMETVRAYRAHGVAVTPTFVARMGPRPVLEDSAAMALLPPAIRTRWRQMAEQGPGAFEAVLDDSAYMAGAAIRNAQMLHDAAVPLLAGTDLGNPFLVPGRSLHRELEVLVDEVGLSPLEALRAATLTPAQAFGMADSLGTVGKGKLSDLVLVRENPLEDIRRLRSIQGVVLAGRYFDREELDELLRRARE